MAEQQPNDASRMSKAEGERFSNAGREEVDQSDPAQSGISREDRGRFSASLHTPRRYDQPIEDDDDPVMPSADATVNTKI
jgi:hypothetical protein